MGARYDAPPKSPRENFGRSSPSCFRWRRGSLISSRSGHRNGPTRSAAEWDPALAEAGVDREASGPARLLAVGTAALFVHGCPSPGFGRFCRSSALLISLFNLMSLTFLFAAIAGFASLWHFCIGSDESFIGVFRPRGSRQDDGPSATLMHPMRLSANVR
jgi:hypothetical protein